MCIVQAVSSKSFFGLFKMEQPHYMDEINIEVGDANDAVLW